MNLITKYGLRGLVLVWVLGLGLGFFKLQNLAPPGNPLYVLELFQPYPPHPAALEGRYSQLLLLLLLSPAV